MEKSSEEIGKAVDEENIELGTIFSTLQFKQFVFKIRAKVEYYGDSTRSKMVCMSATKVDHKEYQNHLIKKLTELTGIVPNMK